MPAVHRLWRFLMVSTCLMFIHRAMLVSAEVRIPCYALRNWFPGKSPQLSTSPFVLNVTDKDGQQLIGFPYQAVYNPGQDTYLITLDSTKSGNQTSSFVAFVLYAMNEFEDEASGDFLAPFPAGVSSEECHYNTTPQMIEVVHNSSGAEQWQSIQVKWRSPNYYPAGKITISAFVANEDGLYWKQNVTLNYLCSVPGCIRGCPHGFAETKFGCQTCECAGAGSARVGFITLLAFLVSFYFLD